jgi:signal transduction histidine kinase
MVRQTLIFQEGTTGPASDVATQGSLPYENLPASVPGGPGAFVVAMPIHEALDLEAAPHLLPQPYGRLCQGGASRLAAILEGISQISHELRHSLALIRGSSQLLMELEKDENRYYAAVVNEEAIHLGRLVEDLLDLSRLELGKFKLVPSWIDLTSLIREAANTTALLSDKHTFEVYLPDEIPPIYADATRIHQVLVNLLTNAIKYSPDGGIITVTVTVENDPEDLVFVSVADQGQGIPEEMLPYLFEPFCCGATATSRVPSVGLGLAISKGIVEAHGGRIWADSRPGAGSVFTFSLKCHNKPLD